jgi:hypothetical protein
MARATMLVETQGKGPASMMTAVDADGLRSLGPFANHYLAMGLEHVRRNDLPGARQMLELMRTRNSSSKPAVANNDLASRYTTLSSEDLTTGAVMEQILEAAIQFAAGERDEALKRIIAAAEAEDKLVFEYGPPAIAKPAWEAAGEMLLAAGKKTEAAGAFRNVLKRYPNRRLSNEGLRAAGL